MRLYEALRIVIEAAEQTQPLDDDLAQEQAEAVEYVREFARGYFPVSEARETFKSKRS